MSEHCFFCGHRIRPDGWNTCESCGATREAANEKRIHARCPRCHDTKLIQYALGPAALQACGRCQGSFLAPNEWDALLDAFTTEPLPTITIPEAPVDEAASLTPYRTAPPAKTEAAPNLEEALTCPTCGDAMERFEFAGVSRIVVDVCRLHGIWFDAGELARVVQTQGELVVRAPLPVQVEFANEPARTPTATPAVHETHTPRHAGFMERFGAIVGRLVNKPRP